MGVRLWRKQCEERAERKRISEKAKPTVGCNASKRRRRRRRRSVFETNWTPYLRTQLPSTAVGMQAESDGIDAESLRCWTCSSQLHKKRLASCSEREV